TWTRFSPCIIQGTADDRRLVPFPRRRKPRIMKVQDRRSGRRRDSRSSLSGDVTMLRTRPWLLFPALLAGWLAAVPAWAGTPEIRDEAGFFSAETVQKAKELVRQIKDRHHEDVDVETYKSPPADKLERVKAMDKGARREFYAEWARERARERDLHGVFILITREPGHLTVGKAGTGRRFTNADRDRVEAHLLAAFKAKEYDKGLLEALHMIDSAMASHGAAAAPSSGRAAPHTAAAPHAGGGSGLMGFLCIALGVILGIWLVVGLIRAFPGAGRRGWGGGCGGCGGGGGGGFMSGLFGGLFGAMAGSWLYDTFFHGHSSAAYGGEPPAAPYDRGPDDDFSSSGGDFG